MTILIWVGAALMLAGVAVLAVCIVTAARLRGADDGKATEARMRQLIVWNYAALALAGFGVVVLVTGGLLT